jgi:transcriptional antiterminator NusG
LICLGNPRGEADWHWRCIGLERQGTAWTQFLITEIAVAMFPGNSQRPLTPLMNRWRPEPETPSAGLRDDSEALEWFALAVRPRHEKAVSRLLRYKGYETFVPLYRRQHRYGRRLRQFELALFSGYVFCRFDALVRLPILMTPGVIRLVGAGRVPTPVDDNEIKALQSAARASFPMQPHAFLTAGERVRIASGPLAGVEGVVVDSTKPFRLLLSITLLQRSVLVEINEDLVLRQREISWS